MIENSGSSRAYVWPETTVVVVFGQYVGDVKATGAPDSTPSLTQLPGGAAFETELTQIINAPFSGAEYTEGLLEDTYEHACDGVDRR